MTDLEGAAKARFELLLRKYDELDQAAAGAKDDKSDKETARDNVKILLRDEVRNMSLGPRSKLDLPGIGTFSFTTQRYYQLPAPNREEFVLMIIRRSLEQRGPELEDFDIDADKIATIIDALKGTEIALLNIGKEDLNAWCKERIEEAEEGTDPLPSYVKYFEDKFVPRILLVSTKTRKREKAAAKKAQQQ